MSAGWAKPRRVFHFYLADLHEPVCGFEDRPRDPDVPTAPFLAYGVKRCRDCREIERELAAISGDPVTEAVDWCVEIECPFFEVRHEHPRSALSS